jgi:hypothetical protein
MYPALKSSSEPIHYFNTLLAYLLKVKGYLINYSFKYIMTLSGNVSHILNRKIRHKAGPDANGGGNEIEGGGAYGRPDKKARPDHCFVKAGV